MGILQSTVVEDSTFLCLVQDNFLTQHVLEPTRDKTKVKQCRRDFRIKIMKFTKKH